MVPAAEWVLSVCNSAKLYDAEVTGVDTGDKLMMMQKLGFDHIIDYKKEDFTKKGQQYDLILDAKTTRSTFDYLRVLSPGGTYVTVGGFLTRVLQIFILKSLIFRFYKKNVHVLALKANKGLNHVNELFETGKIHPVIDGPYPLKELPDLIQYFGEGKHKGKIVIKVDHKDEAEIS